MFPGTPSHGRALEHLVANELRAWLSYREVNLPLTYFRSQSRIEDELWSGGLLPGL